MKIQKKKFNHLSHPHQHHLHQRPHHRHHRQVLNHGSGREWRLNMKWKKNKREQPHDHAKIASLMAQYAGFSHFLLKFFTSPFSGVASKTMRESQNIIGKVE